MESEIGFGVPGHPGLHGKTLSKKPQKGSVAHSSWGASHTPEQDDSDARELQGSMGSRRCLVLEWLFGTLQLLNIATELWVLIGCW